MADGENSSKYVPGIIVALLIIIGAVVVRHFPFEPVRPTVTESFKAQSTDLQNVDARLWEDPFAAITEYRGSLAKRATESRDVGGQAAADVSTINGPVDYNHDIETLVSVLHQPSGSGLLVLPVIINGGPHVEQAEERKRARYAVLSGLSRWEVQPDNAEHLGYIDLATRRPSIVTAKCRGFGVVGEVGGGKGDPQECDFRNLPAVVPFEFFHPEHPASSPVGRFLVLWLDASAFERSPLHRLTTLFSALALCSSSPPKATISIVDASGSTVVNELFRSVETFRQQSGAHQCLERASVYSAAATASVDGALDDTGRFEKAKLTFVRTIAQDRDLMPTLVRELAYRGVRMKDGGTRIALISEWDTEYGRSLPNTVSEAFCSDSSLCKNRVRRYSYLRGLDGVLPSGTDPSEVAPKRATDVRGSPSGPQMPLERAEGRSQFDYLRRLALKLKRESAEHGEFAAIGVLGTDVYDKLLVLQAIRDEFPRAIFFTTDMDARLLHQDDFRWTRNLVVVSSYGLELHSVLQQDIPPFRDGYQTSLFLAVQVAMWNAGVTGSTPDAKHLRIAQQEMTRWLKSPRIFEIGRSSAIDLASFDATAAPAKASSVSCRDPGTFVPCGGIHPVQPNNAKWWRTVSLWMIVFLASFSLTLHASSRVRSWIADLYLRRYKGHRHIAWRDSLAWTLAVAATVGFFVLFSVYNREPFALFEGVSVWPTELIRAAAAVLAFLFLRHIYRLRRSVNATLGREYFLDESVSLNPSLMDIACPPRLRDLSTLKSLLSVLKRTFGGSTAAKQNHDPADATRLWAEHLYQSCELATIIRVSSGVLVFFVLTVTLHKIFGLPHVPYRGDFSLAVDQLLLFCVVPLNAVLLFAVWDAIRRCGKFADWLSRPEQTLWPDAARAAACSRMGLPLDHKRGYVDYWLDIRFVADWTKAIAASVYYPGIVIAMLILGRSSFFDHWETPFALRLTFLFSGSYVAASVWILWRAAANVRRAALEALTSELLKSKGDPRENLLASQLEVLIVNVRSLQEGAFVPFFRQPVVTTVLGIFGSASTVSLLEYLVLKH
jgi:hypothetical protein